MTSRAELKEVNAATFASWAASKTNEEFKEYVSPKGTLNRSSIASECGFAKSVLNQNPLVKTALQALEDRLRAEEILPQLNASSETQTRDRDAKKRSHQNKRLGSLEQENAALKAQVLAMREALSKYELIDKFLEDTGRLPR